MQQLAQMLHLSQTGPAGRGEQMRPVVPGGVIQDLAVRVGLVALEKGRKKTTDCWLRRTFRPYGALENDESSIKSVHSFHHMIICKLVGSDKVDV